MNINGYYDPTLDPLKDSGAAAKTKSGQAKKSDQAQSGDSSDTVQLSSASKEAARVKTLVESTSDLRLDKVEALKAQVSSGQYKVDPDKVAQKLVDEHLSELV